MKGLVFEGPCVEIEATENVVQGFSATPRQDAADGVEELVPSESSSNFRVFVEVCNLLGLDLPYADEGQHEGQLLSKAEAIVLADGAPFVAPCRPSDGKEQSWGSNMVLWPQTLFVLTV